MNCTVISTMARLGSRISSVVPPYVSMTPASLDIYSSLPNELILEILTLHAASSPDNARTVAQVASWAHKLALPYIFDTITDNKRLKSLPQFAQARVRNVWIKDGISIPDVASLSWVWSAASNMAVPSSFLIRHQCHSCTLKTALNTGSPSCRTLTITTHMEGSSWDFLEGNPIFTKAITHLRLCATAMSLIPPIIGMPALTHIAFCPPWDDATTDELLEQKGLKQPQWRMVVLQYRVKRPSEIIAHVRAFLGYSGCERVFPGFEPHTPGGVFTEWVRNAGHKDSDIWSQAVQLRAAVLANDEATIARMWQVYAATLI